MMDENPYQAPRARSKLRAYSAVALVLIGSAWIVYAASVAVGSLGMIALGVLLASPLFLLASWMLWG